MKNWIQLNLLLIMLSVLVGCTVSTDTGIATMPAARTGTLQESDRKEQSLPTTVAILPFSNDTNSEFAYEVVRRTIANHFSTTNYRWLHWRDIDRRLALAGTTDVDAAAADELMQLLGVDGLIYGNITHFNKTFAGIYSQIAVGVELRFIDQHGETIWSVDDVRRSHAGGVSSSPVGLLINALASAKHLYGDINLYRAADDLGRDLVAELPQPAALAGRSKPVIRDVIHSGVGQYLRYGDTLEIALEGAPGMTAAAVIEELGVIDLSETAPGQYVGQTTIGRDVDLTNVVVTGRLLDEVGLSADWISPYGLLNIDNTPPASLTDVHAESRDGAVIVSWALPAEPDLASFEVSRLASATGDAIETRTSSNPRIEIDGLVNFEQQYISVVAVDRAGNHGTPTITSAVAAPDARYQSARTLGNPLPEVISGVVRLTREASPYQVARPLRVATGGVLLIDAGVEIVAASTGSINVLGEMHGFGNADLPIRVSDDGQGYGEFLVLQTTAPVTLEHFIFNKGGSPVRIVAGQPLITMSEFIDNAFSAMTISGTARPTIQYCRIKGAGSSGVVIEGQAQPRFQSNVFESNDPFHLQNGSTYEIDVTDNNRFDPPASAMTILGNVTFSED